MDRRAWLKLGGGAAVGAAMPARAQDSRVTRIVVPYVAGGQTDLMARAMVPLLTKELDRTVIVENRPGAAALIGTQAVRSAPPDGNTLLFHNSGFVALPMLSKAPTYDVAKDFVAVARTGIGPNFMMANGNVPARTVPEFIAWAKAQPQGVMAANSGIGSAGHLTAQLFAKRTGINVTHVPYKGSAETANAVLAGEVHFQMTSPTEALIQHARAGRVRFLGVATKERTTLSPEVPPIAETVPDFVVAGWFGLLAPGATLPDQVRRLSAAIGKTMADKEVRDRYLSLYMEPAFLAAGAFQADIDESITFWKTVISELNLQPT